VHGGGGSRGEHSTAADYTGTDSILYNPTVAEDQGKEEEKFDFTSEGEGYISLDEARVLAMRTAVETPGDYGSSYQGVTMFFEVVEATETDDFYYVTLLFRPQGNFDGTPGQEQFVVGKEGAISVRQVHSFPAQTSASPAGTARKGGGLPILPVAIGLVVIGIIAAVGVVFTLGGFGSGSVPVAAVAPTETTISIQPLAPTEAPSPTEPTVSKNTVEEAIQPGQIITATLAPSTSTSSVRPTENPEADPSHVKSFDTIYVMTVEKGDSNQGGTAAFGGKSITFQIGNAAGSLVAKETAIWESGSITYLDLSASFGSSRNLADPGSDRLTNVNIGVFDGAYGNTLLPPNMFSGSATIDGRGVPEGTMVTAWIDGKLVAESKVILRSSSPRFTATGSLFSPVDDSLNVIWDWNNKSQNWKFYSPDTQHFEINTYTDPKSEDIIWVNVSGDVEFQSHLLVTGLNLIALDIPPASGDKEGENIPTTRQAFSDLLEPKINLYRVWRFDNAEKNWQYWDPRPAFLSANTLNRIRQFDIIQVFVGEDQSFQGTIPLFSGVNEIVFR